MPTDAGKETRLGTGARLLACILLGAVGCSSSNKNDKRVVSVAAAADLRFALGDLVRGFEKKHPDIEIKVTDGASGNFYAQLSNRAPFDMFFSADIEYPHRLAEKGFAYKDEEVTYAIGHLVLWVPRESAIDVEKKGLDALLDARVKKIAIANPDHAPYGRAAVAALRRLGLSEKVRKQLVPGENVGQAAAYIYSGAAQIGIIPLSLALAPKYREGRHWRIPDDAYPPLKQGCIILKWAKDKEAAETFRDFVTGTEGKAILRRYGFSLPGD
jgi:molybdate transport system substrate-binding protein